MFSPPKTSALAAVTACLMLAWSPLFAAGQNAGSGGAAQLPPELKGSKIYHLAAENGSGKEMQNLVITKRVTYQDISTERLLLNVYVSLQPVDRDATVTKMYFQNVKVGGFPVHLQPFEQQFQLSKSQTVDLPGPLECSIVYSDLDSIAPLRELVDKQKILVTGDSFIQVKLNTVQKIFMRSKDVVIPVKFSQEVPLEMFSDSPLLKFAASKVLDVITDPSTTAAATLAKEHVEKFQRARALSSLAQSSVYLLYCEYVLRNPAGASEKFTQTGTGFVISADGKILTSKRIIQPWKFDPQVAYLIAKYHLELDPKAYRLAAWPAGAAIRLPGGQMNFQTALTEDQQSLKVLKVGADAPAKTEYHDADSGETATVDVEGEGGNDVAILQIRGDKLQPLTLAGTADSGSPASLLGYPYGLSQPEADPKIAEVKASREGALLVLDQPLEPGESGAPLVNGDGKVVGLAGNGKQCNPTDAFRALIP
jgi:S1-C subfamily serine protease